MIEKINFNNSTIVDAVCAHKINEIIKILNAIVVDTKDGTFIDGSKKAETADPYAEQRKWRGKLCKFWNDRENPEDCVYGVLRNVFDLYQNGCPFQCGGGVWYEYCEPVSEDLIYKGE